MWAFVPSAGGILADWGAEVIKIEAPTGDPIRGLVSGGVGKTDGITYTWELFNRGKRGIALDLKEETAQKIVYQLAETADVFLTSLLPRARKKLKIDHDDIRAANPQIIYAVGSGQGARGPEAEKGGYDSISFWSRGSVSSSVTPKDQPPGRHAHGRVRRLAQRHGAGGRNRGRAGAQGEDRGGRARRRVVARHRDVVDADGDRGRRGGGPRRDAQGRSHAGPESAREHLSDVGWPLDRAVHAATRRVLGRLLHGDRPEGLDRRRALRQWAGARAARRGVRRRARQDVRDASRWRSGSRSWRRSPVSGMW